MSTCRRQIADSQQWCGLKDAILHLHLLIVYLIWGLLRHCWTLQRWLEAAADCWRGPQYGGKCSFYFKCYFFRTTPANRDLREKAVYFPPRWRITTKILVKYNLIWIHLKCYWDSWVKWMNSNRVSYPMLKLNTFSAMVWPLEIFWFMQICQFYFKKHKPMLKLHNFKQTE